MRYLVDYRDHVGASEGKYWKSTLFRSDALLLGVNGLEPGQVQAPHTHAGQDKFYFVVEGRGSFTVGAESFEAGPGAAIWAPADAPHGVENRGPDRLVLLVGIAPAPPER